MEHLLPHYADIQSVHQTGARPQSSRSTRVIFNGVTGWKRPEAVVSDDSIYAPDY
jgi:hypothetical protein